MSVNNNTNLATVEQAKEMGLLSEEFDKIKGNIRRTPNFCELSVLELCGLNTVLIKTLLFG